MRNFNTNDAETIAAGFERFMRAAHSNEEAAKKMLFFCEVPFVSLYHGDVDISEDILWWST